MDLYKSINSSGNTALYPKAAIAFKRDKMWIYLHEKNKKVMNKAWPSYTHFYSSLYISEKFS